MKSCNSICLARYSAGLLLLLGMINPFATHAQFAGRFVHPGGLLTTADLQRIKTNVLAGNHPWIDDWNRLLKDPEAQSNWRSDAHANMGFSRQRADRDAHAAYLNTLRWYVSGDTNCAECAVRICNAWSAKVNQVPSGSEIVGLGGITIFHFALAGELLRVYPGWKTADFNRYANMMERYFYPASHDFLSHHNGACISYYWANWDAGNIGALMAIGVLCDNTNIFNEGVEYFKHGAGMGSISNAVPFLYSTNLGQWQESGRDQEHAQLGVGLLGSACQVAWNQGLDLFGYDNNRLLAGAEYVAKCNLSYPASSIPYTFYNNCANARQCYLSINGLGRLDDRPVWELIYNHYAVLKGLPAPYVKEMAQLMRPEHGSTDHLGYGTLAFTLKASASPYPPNPIPPVPTRLTASAGVSQVFLNWAVARDHTAQGYIVRRATSPHGPFVQIAVWNGNTLPQYTDRSVTNGVTYYYVVAATNQAGASAVSKVVQAEPVAAGTLPIGWTNDDIGKGDLAGDAKYAGVSQNTFIVKDAGGHIGGKSDALNFTYRQVSGDFVITGRMVDVRHWAGRDMVGLMLRESLSPAARAVALTLGEIGGRECRFRSRSAPAAAMIRQEGNDYTWLPVWFKIQRAGDVFTGYQSVDGTNWFKVGESRMSVPQTCFVGLALAGDKPDEFNQAVFDHVKVEGSSGTLPVGRTN
ncbi:MAG TPA: alginate lyase family protein [Verrucomicrobiae bacterium]|nr:alginate lyase family protein [Verrucomicrobiae bacterium]